MDTIANGEAGGGAPVHLWVVGVLATLWNAFGCVDYLLTNLRDPRYVARFAPDMIDYIDAFPAWVIVTWGMAVGFALIGSLLLLARSLWAAYCFAFAVLALAATQLYQSSTVLPPSMNNPASWLLTSVIWLVAVALLLYAVRMRTRKVLR
ncbi:hypothetical protein ABVV53_00505 [Novosphingobium sp. RD2P27]|uniref:Sugar transporter n=1 Tax=Novosphingobium kalidii TaxID=3230299 RepID=A0ABV2CWH2_9SPHN